MKLIFSLFVAGVFSLSFNSYEETHEGRESLSHKKCSEDSDCQAA